MLDSEITVEENSSRSCCVAACCCGFVGRLRTLYCMSRCWYSVENLCRMSCSHRKRSAAIRFARRRLVSSSRSDLAFNHAVTNPADAPTSAPRTPAAAEMKATLAEGEESALLEGGTGTAVGCGTEKFWVIVFEPQTIFVSGATVAVRSAGAVEVCIGRRVSLLGWQACVAWGTWPFAAAMLSSIDENTRTRCLARII